jgi:hypothetical protein
MTPIARVEVSPARAEIVVGQTVQLAARALDATGQEVPNARIRWLSGGGEGSVDSLGVVRGGYIGQVRVTALASVGSSSPTFAQAVVNVLPQPASRVVIAPAPAVVLAGTRLTFDPMVYSPQGDRRHDPVQFTSSESKVASVTGDGRFEAFSPGRATITATAGRATATHEVRVVANTLAQLNLIPSAHQARTGDVIRFEARGTDASGRSVDGLVTRWAVAATTGVGAAQIDAAGAFVAETPGRYTVTATAAGRSADAIVTVEARRVGRGIEVVGRVPIAERAAEVWIHPSGRCAYLSTIADRIYVIDITTQGEPTIVDSMMADARLINDVMTTEDGAYGVFSREGASSRKNGLVVFEASDPCHPRPIAQYTETVSGGVHSSFVYQGYVYLTDDATGSLRMIDIRDPYNPREAARWQTEQTDAGRYIHDVAVSDGLAYLSYWNDGLIVLDVGNGMKGGSPENPQFVSQYKYDLNALYARVDQVWGLGARGTHTAWRAGKYVFIGDEVYAAKAAKGLTDGNNLTFGRMQVLDVSDIEHPKLVAWYEPTDGGVHNLWVEGDTLYMGNYQGGARVVDISGELKGDLLRQGREISWILTADAEGSQPHTPFAWGAVVRDGHIFVPDINSGLWILRLEPKDEVTP